LLVDQSPRSKQELYAMRKSALFAFAPVGAAITIAGCGGSGGESSHSGTARGEAGEVTGQAINAFGAPGHILAVKGTAVHDG
jgi:hypothetical protein